MTERTKPMHWLSRVAERAGLPGTDGIPIDPSSPIEKSWKAVGDTCGVGERELATLVANAFRLELADFNTAEAHAIKLVPDSLAKKYQVFPLREDDRHIVVATCDPTNIEIEQALGFASGRTPIFRIATPSELHEAILHYYAPDQAVENLLTSVDAEIADSVRLVEVHKPEVEDTTELTAGPVVKLTNLVIQDAINQGASDVHIQPGTTGGNVRFRIDGVLRHYMQLPMPALSRVVSRIKIIGALDIADRLRPQDGRARIAIGNVNYDLRISTVPTRGSEKAVIRILDSEHSNTLDTIDMPDPERRRFEKLLSSREGIVVVTGPTGSGKTTTLYAALQYLATEDVNIMTVEDPVEYELAGLTQIQVETKQGVTFASALRAILRQDPDVILIGEIRDAETAQIAVQAALTGHLVLATLHTNDAIGAIRRFVDLGVDRSSIAETLRGATAQRLMRRVCKKCAEPVAGSMTPEEKMFSQTYGVAQTVRAVGCERCGDSGYQGRIPIVEMFTMSPTIEEMVVSGQTTTPLTAAAVQGGMRTLRSVALERVNQGVTTLQEVARVLGDADESPSGEVPEKAQTNSTMPPSDEEQEETPSIQVMVVDDDGVVRTVARALLEREGYVVTEAADGSEALALVSKGAKWDLMILDLDMPEVNGRQVLERVRSSVGTAATPVIVLTGSTDPSTEIELMEQGADDYIRKPIDPPRFAARVKAALRRASV